MPVVERRTIAIRKTRAAGCARRLEALGDFGIGGLDLPIEKKGDPHHGKERFKEPEHSDLRTL
jgi:hypothetical protein